MKNLTKNQVFKYFEENNIFFKIHGKIEEMGYDRSKPIFITNWSGVPEEVKERIEKTMDYEIGWSDEWMSCSICDNAVRSVPESFMWEPSYIIREREGGIICRTCVQDGEFELLHGYLNTTTRAVPSWAITLLQNEGFYLYSDMGNKTTYVSGLHDGMNDRPDQILDKIVKETENQDFFAKYNYVFAVRETSSYCSIWSLYIKKK